MSYIKIKDTGAVWGNITGDITNQTDLINYINSFYFNLDGGSSSSVYLITMIIDGGTAGVLFLAPESSMPTSSQVYDAGGA
jgi:hypothetical protein